MNNTAANRITAAGNVTDTNCATPETPETAGPFEQLGLRLFEVVDRTKPPPDRGLWRELLTLARATGPVHHVAWTLYGRSNSDGRAHVKTRTLATDAGLCVRTVKAALTELKRIGVVRWRRTRGASHYEINRGRGFEKCTTCTSRSAGDARPVGLDLKGQRYIPGLNAPPVANDLQAQADDQQQRDGLSRCSCGGELVEYSPTSTQCVACLQVRTNRPSPAAAAARKRDLVAEAAGKADRRQRAWANQVARHGGRGE